MLTDEERRHRDAIADAKEFLLSMRLVAVGIEARRMREWQRRNQTENFA